MTASGSIFRAQPGSIPVSVKAAELRVREPLREATLRGLNDPPRTLSEFRGEPLIINLCASWCGPCGKEMASLD
jgi:hypothetical protein